MKQKGILVLFIICLTNFYVAAWWNSNRNPIFVAVYYKDIGLTHIQCIGTIIRYGQTVQVLIAGTCLYDDWGNFLYVPKSLHLVILNEIINIEKIIPHPRFWFGNTQNNIAILETFVEGPPLIEVELLWKFALKIQPEHDDPVNCKIIVRNMQNEALLVERTEIVDRDKYCYRQMFPLPLRLRDDNVCGTIPVYGVRPELERRYAGSPVVCFNDTTTEVALYAILSFNYRCHNRIRVAVFTRLSFHKQFLEDPQKFIAKEMASFELRQNGSEGVPYSRAANYITNSQRYFIFILSLFVAIALKYL